MVQVIYDLGLEDVKSFSVIRSPVDQQRQVRGCRLIYAHAFVHAHAHAHNHAIAHAHAFAFAAPTPSPTPTRE